MSTSSTSVPRRKESGEGPTPALDAVEREVVLAAAHLRSALTRALPSWIHEGVLASLRERHPLSAMYLQALGHDEHLRSATWRWERAVHDWEISQALRRIVPSSAQQR